MERGPRPRLLTSACVPSCGDVQGPHLPPGLETRGEWQVCPQLCVVADPVAGVLPASGLSQAAGSLHLDEAAWLRGAPLQGWATPSPTASPPWRRGAPSSGTRGASCSAPATSSSGARVSKGQDPCPRQRPLSLRCQAWGPASQRRGFPGVRPRSAQVLLVPALPRPRPCPHPPLAPAPRDKTGPCIETQLPPGSTSEK